MKLANSMFQASLFKMLFTKIILIYFFVISTLSTQTLIPSQIDIGFHCFYLEITWKIHRILCYKRSGNPVYVRDDFNKLFAWICMYTYYSDNYITLYPICTAYYSWWVTVDSIAPKIYNGANHKSLEAKNKQPNGLTFIIILCGFSWWQYI